MSGEATVLYVMGCFAVCGLVSSIDLWLLWPTFAVLYYGYHVL